MLNWWFIAKIPSDMASESLGEPRISLNFLLDESLSKYARKQRWQKFILTEAFYFKIYINNARFLVSMVSKVPRHVGIILDGNRRYAKRLGLKPWLGHEYGIRKLEQLLKWAQELGIREITLYAFSTENFKRTKTEKDFLFKLFKREFESMKHRQDIFNNRIRINIVGRLEMFPEDIRKSMLDIMSITKKHKNFILNFAMAYGGRQEITDAVKKLAHQVKDNKIEPDEINEETITNNLYIKNEPDLVIRPSGEMRTSNFLMWQSAYSEWIFIDKLWPEFTKLDLEHCILEFSKRERRFGK